jgi:hypothetical protein
MRANQRRHRHRPQQRVDLGRTLKACKSLCKLIGGSNLCHNAAGPPGKRDRGPRGIIKGPRGGQSKAGRKHRVRVGRLEIRPGVRNVGHAARGVAHYPRRPSRPQQLERRPRPLLVQ